MNMKIIYNKKDLDYFEEQTPHASTKINEGAGSIKHVISNVLVFLATTDNMNNVDIEMNISKWTIAIERKL